MFSCAPELFGELRLCPNPYRHNALLHATAMSQKSASTSSPGPSLQSRDIHQKHFHTRRTGERLLSARNELLISCATDSPWEQLMERETELSKPESHLPPGQTRAHPWEGPWITVFALLSFSEQEKASHTWEANDKWSFITTYAVGGTVKHQNWVNRDADLPPLQPGLREK